MLLQVTEITYDERKKARWVNTAYITGVTGGEYAILLMADGSSMKVSETPVGFALRANATEANRWQE